MTSHVRDSSAPSSHTARGQPITAEGADPEPPGYSGSDFRPREASRQNRSVVDRHLWEIAATRDVLWAFGLIVVLWIGYSLRSVLTPIFIGLGFAYLFDPLVSYMGSRFHIPRPVTVSLILLVILTVLVGTFVWLGPTFSQQVFTLAEKIPQYVSTVSDRYHLELGSLSDYLTDLTTTFKDDPMSVVGPLFSGTGQAFGMIGTIVGSTLNLTLVMVLVPIVFFLFAWDFDRMTSGIMTLVPLGKRARTRQVLARMDRAVSGFFRGRLVVGVITAALYSVGWAFADVPYWFLLGTVTGVLTVVPYASAIGWPLAVLLKYLDVLASQDPGGGWLAIVVWPSVTYLSVQFIESWVLTPWIQSQSLDLSATTILIVVLIGGAVGGFLGLLLAIPLAACVKILFQEIVAPRLLRERAAPTVQRE